MCELFAVSSPEQIKCNQLLKSFFSNANEHPHGWGMAFFYGNAVSLEKEPRLALKSDYLKQRLCFDITADQMFAHIQKGQSDSERILLYLMDRINEAQTAKGAGLNRDERFAIVEAVIAEITEGNNKVNIMIFDGSLLYVHSNYRDSLHTCRKGNALIVSTRPLDDDDWQVVPLNTVLAYRRGVLKYTGTPHGNEYFEDWEQIKYLYLDYAAL